ALVRRISFRFALPVAACRGRALLLAANLLRYGRSQERGGYRIMSGPIALDRPWRADRWRQPWPGGMRMSKLPPGSGNVHTNAGVWQRDHFRVAEVVRSCARRLPHEHGFG